MVVAETSAAWVWTIGEHGLAAKVEAFQSRVDALRAAGPQSRVSE